MKVSVVALLKALYMDYYLKFLLLSDCRHYDAGAANHGYNRQT